MAIDQLPLSGSILIAKLFCVGFIKDMSASVESWLGNRGYDIHVGDAVMFLGSHVYVNNTTYYSLQVLHKGRLVNILTKVKAQVIHEGGLNWLPDLNHFFDIFSLEEANGNYEI